MTTCDLEESLPTREEVRQLVEQYARINEVARISPREEKVGMLPIFIGAEKEEYKFQQDISDEVEYLGKIENRTKKIDPTRTDLQQIATKRMGDRPDGEHYRLITDKVMDVIEDRKFEIPIYGVKDEGDVRIGTKTVKDVRFITFKDLDEARKEVRPSEF